MAVMCIVLSAQKPEGLVKKASVAPVIGGEIDDVWSEANVYNVSLPYRDEVPTLGAEGETTWKALWTYDGIYLLIEVADDFYYPWYAPDPEGSVWEYDLLWIYFDTNQEDLEDGLGVRVGEGHYQVAPEFWEGQIDGSPVSTLGPMEGLWHAITVENPSYFAELFIPFTFLVNKDGIQVDPAKQLGFDVCVIDRDPGDAARKRAVWANIGTYDESWFNMDECGIITLDAYTPPTLVDSISLTGGTISENNGTLQIGALVLPEDAFNKNLSWSVDNGSGMATITQEGELTAIADGSVTVKAAAVDGSGVEGTVEVLIIDQAVTMEELNVIKNGYFDSVEENGEATHWEGKHNDDSQLPVVVSGVAIATPLYNEEFASPWDYQFNQVGLLAKPNAPYYFSFVAWAEESRPLNVSFGDIPANAYERYGATTDPRSFDERSDWTFEISTEPTRYAFDVTFDRIKPNTVQAVQFWFGESDVVSYLDSVILVNVNDLALMEGYKPVTSIDVSGEADGTSVEAGANLQMRAVVNPLDASISNVMWRVVPGTGIASIDENGLLAGTATGSVKVMAIARDDSNVSGELEVLVTSPVGFQKHPVQTIKVFPNPACNELNVIFNTQNNPVCIYNGQGKLMTGDYVSGGAHRFDISNFPPGIYFVKIGERVAKFVK